MSKSVKFRLLEVDFAEPPPSVTLRADETGCGLIARWRQRLVGFEMIPLPSGAALTSDELTALAQKEFAQTILEHRIAQALATSDPALPSLTVAICTKDRPAQLARLLHSISPLLTKAPFRFAELIVVDNASSAPDTRDVVAAFPAVRYLREPRAGLDFARNAAVAAAAGDLIAFLDDDVVVDAGWMQGLADAWRGCPSAGGFTGLVLPFRLETEAQVLFELRGGFRRGFRRIEYRRSRFGHPLHPSGAGVLGTGANMAFDRRLLTALGGFDEALDTGAPLPGGGDLDMFYRVLRAGRAIVYEPRCAVFHEHRETVAQLRRQYWSWGLGLMAFLAKASEADPALRKQHRALVRWWLVDQLKSLLRGVWRADLRRIDFALAELRGGLRGVAGEYRRSRRRVQAIRDAA